MKGANEQEIKVETFLFALRKADKIIHITKNKV